MSLGLILIIIVVILLLGGFSGRFGGYGFGHPDHPGRAASHGQALIRRTANTAALIKRKT